MNDLKSNIIDKPFDHTEFMRAYEDSKGKQPSSRKIVREYNKKVARRRRKEGFNRLFFNTLTIISFILIVATTFKVFDE